MGQTIRNRNEVMQGPSPEVIKAIQNFDPYKATYYAEGYYDSALANALSKRLGIIKDRIIVCYGAEDFLRAAFDSLDVKTDSVLTHEYYYGYYKTYLEGKGLILNTFKVKEGDNSFSFDIKDCIEQYKLHQPKILIIASPNNPTGNSISLPELKNILNTVDSKTLVILDEAYWGFDPGYEEQSFLVLLERHPNLAILRSFSKYYALAGLRIGFVLCGAEVKKILRYENLYLGMSRLLEDVAIAALNSETYYKGVAKEIEDERTRLVTEINKLAHFKAYESKANLVFMHANSTVDTKLEQVLPSLEILSIKRSFGSYWRITVDLADINTKLFKTLQNIDESAQGNFLFT